MYIQMLIIWQLDSSQLPQFQTETGEVFILCGGLDGDWVGERACDHLGLYPVKVQ